MCRKPGSVQLVASNPRIGGQLGSKPMLVANSYVKRWWGQYLKGLPEGQGPLPAMQRLEEYLRANIPPSDSLPGGSIVHGDFRLDNLVFGDGGFSQVAAVLDWELSTLGDPLADLAYCCQPYYLPPGLEVLPTLRTIDGSPKLPRGVPSE
eukprot:scaffold6103_cov44-Prasinocladus_malaysianus.AAC.3